MPNRTRYKRALENRVAKIYGASWTHASSPVLTRTDAAIGMVAAAGLDAGVVVNNFDQAEIYKDITEITDALGNVFVRIPKFWIEKTDDGATKATWRISKRRFGSAYLPKCFVSTAGAELPYIDVGKYNASLSGANKLESLPGKYPLINKNIVDFRGYAQANGAGYQQLDIHVVDLLQTLFMVEFATLNSQSIMAGYTSGEYVATDTATVAENAVNRIVVLNAVAATFVVGQAISCGTALGGIQIFYGRTITSIDVYDATQKAISFDGATVNIAVGNIIWSSGWKSGFSASITAKSGGITSLSSGKYPCVYRGIENPWGSVYEFVDGVNINDRQAWVCADVVSYASNLFAAPYEVLGYVNGSTDGYSNMLGFDAVHPYAQFPIYVAGGADSTHYYSDYYYSSVGQRIALLGGPWYYGTSAGLFYWALSVASSDTYINFAGRLLRKPL
jgi:hypothetical protein